MDNKTKKDQLHDLMPKYFKTRQNPNWKALIDAIGQSDQNVADLVEEVKKQFFITTANRPYLDRLGANYKVARPKLIGMEDADFRRYIPVLAYQPKQVKLAIDQLLDIFFFKESTTAFMRSEMVEPYFFKDGWELSYFLDAAKTETIIFSATDFSNIATATAEEIVSAINRQAKESFAIVFEDSIAKTKSVRLFTKTIGSKGSVQIIGGRANIALQFQGYSTISGNLGSTVWGIDVIGNTVTYTHLSGGSPNISGLQVGDVAIIDIPDQEGSFPIIETNVQNGSFTFLNAFATTTVFDHGSNPYTYVKFFTPEKAVVYTQKLRAMAWEVRPGELVVEMPASPPVVKRKLYGSAHHNGVIAAITAQASNTTITIDKYEDWPIAGGYFVLKPKNEILMHIKTDVDDEISIAEFESRFDRREQYYHYSARAGNTLSGITPPLPDTTGVFEVDVLTAIRDTDNVVTVTTSTAHNFQVGENVGVFDAVVGGGMVRPVDGCFEILSTPSDTQFTYRSFGDAGTASGGRAVIERICMAETGSLVYLTTANLDTGILGPYMWNLKAPFVLSALTTSLTTEIQAGDALRSISVSGPNDLPSQEGYLVFGFGTEVEEGPVRYLYKPNEYTINIDPAYVFTNNHAAGSAITMIRRRGAHVMSGLGKELPLYLTDPSIARPILQALIESVKSAGIFLEFIVRYPQQYYATLDVYKVGVDPG